MARFAVGDVVTDTATRWETGKIAEIFTNGPASYWINVQWDAGIEGLYEPDEIEVIYSNPHPSDPEVIPF